MRVPPARNVASTADQVRDLLRSLADKGPQPIMRVSERLRKVMLADGYVGIADGPALLTHAEGNRKRPLTIKYLSITDAGRAMLETKT